jgi:nucleotide-binding universal stress UspA family protein
MPGSPEKRRWGRPVCSPPYAVAVGDVAGSVREEARRHATDLVVIGRGLLQETLGRLRTHAYGIIRQAPCPVISV